MIPCLFPHVSGGPWSSLQSAQESREQSAGLGVRGADARLSARTLISPVVASYVKGEPCLPQSCCTDENAVRRSAQPAHRRRSGRDEPGANG